MKKRMIMCEELDQIKAPKAGSEQWQQGFFSGLGAAGMIGGLVMGAMITFGTT